MTPIRVCALLAVLSAAASADPRPASHVRSTDRRVDVLIAQGTGRSPVLQSLVRRLDESNVLVYVEYSLLPSHLTGRLRFATATGEWRYLRIQIECRQSLISQTVALAHELQHAVEIADAAAADEPSVERLYHAIGFPIDGSEHSFESSGAQETAAQVRRELIAPVATGGN